MGIVFKIIMILSFAYISLQAFKTQWNERKEYVAKLKSEGKAATPKQAIFYFFALFGGLYIIGVLITLIIFYIKRRAFITSEILSIGAIVFIIELCIGGVVWIIQDFLRDCKQEGVKKAILYLIATLILLVGFLYVKYKF